MLQHLSTDCWLKRYAHSEHFSPRNTTLLAHKLPTSFLQIELLLSKLFETPVDLKLDSDEFGSDQFSIQLPGVCLHAETSVRHVPATLHPAGTCQICDPLTADMSKKLGSSSGLELQVAARCQLVPDSNRSSQGPHEPPKTSSRTSSSACKAEKLNSNMVRKPLKQCALAGNYELLQWLQLCHALHFVLHACRKPLHAFGRC